jgi:hypothetical protein
MVTGDRMLRDGIMLLYYALQIYCCVWARAQESRRRPMQTVSLGAGSARARRVSCVSARRPKAVVEVISAPSVVAGSCAD